MARGARRVLDRPMAVYEVHLGSWARVPEEDDRFLTYRELAERLVPYVKDLGFTHVELMPVMEHPFYGSWGYQVLGFFAPTAGTARPTTSSSSSTRAIRRGIGVILDWVPGALPEGRARPGALRRHRALRTRRSAAGRAAGLGHAHLQLRPPRGPQLPASQRAVLAGGVPHRRPARRRRRVDAVSRLLAQGRRVDSEPYGGRENLDAIGFLQELNAPRYGEYPAHDDRRGIDGVARRQPAGAPGRPRVQLQMEHGLDARHARYIEPGSGPPPVPSQQ